MSLPFISSEIEINSFDRARAVFLRAGARIEAAKRYFVLDGCVTDHVNLLQEHSKMYHYLALFETDHKRKLAMESRRVDMLSSLLKTLNKAAFEALHKQLAYELGEVYMTLLEFKLEKLRSTKVAGAVGGLSYSVPMDERSMNKADLAKCNSYIQQALAMFAHFTSFYAKSEERAAKASTTYSDLTLVALCGAACSNPDESLLNDEEIRPFLNAHFLSARLLSKVLLPPQLSKQERAVFMVAALERYRWLCKATPTICTRLGVEVSNVFGEEIAICKEMVELLPSKVDRMIYMGEGGLSI